MLSNWKSSELSKFDSKAFLVLELISSNYAYNFAAFSSSSSSSSAGLFSSSVLSPSSLSSSPSSVFLTGAAGFLGSGFGLTTFLSSSSSASSPPSSSPSRRLEWEVNIWWLLADYTEAAVNWMLISDTQRMINRANISPFILF